jgi:hypothetical protein
MGPRRWARVFVCWGMGGLAVAQQSARTVGFLGRLEFPVTLQQSLVAGKTPVGTAVRAKLEMATLVNGMVIPQGATLSGHVEQSVGKTQTSASRLKIKIDAADWKHGSTPLHAYFTGCFYPYERNPFADSQNGEFGMHGDAPASASGLGANTGPRPFPGSAESSGAEQDPRRFPQLAPEAPASHVSSKWERLNGVDRVQEADGSVEVTSASRNIKLDKNTTYMLEQSAPAPAR